jgi:hypothetical protein
MGRRAILMYGGFGVFLPRSVQGSVGAGLGLSTSQGNVGLILPTREITHTGEEVTINGVQMVFQMTPGTEAPAEMNTYLPQFRAMWMAENTTNTMHNILTLRGAQVRDALNWSKYINETIDLYCEGTDVKFQAHHWPMWGNGRIIDYWKKQRDLYKYIHDRSVNLMDQGYTGIEIANLVELPDELSKEWFNRGYYGSLKHNTRAVYQRYMGFYDGNPTTLDELPPRRRPQVPRLHGRRHGGPGEGQGGLRPRRVPLGGGGAEARRLRRWNQHRRQGSAGRCLRADGISGRGGNVALDLPPRRPRAAQRCAHGPACPEPVGSRCRQGNATEHDLRLSRRAARQRDGDRQDDHAQPDLHRYRRVLRPDGGEQRAQPIAQPRGKAGRHPVADQVHAGQDRAGRPRAADVGASPDVTVGGRAEAVSELFGLIETPPFWFNIVTA